MTVQSHGAPCFGGSALGLMLCCCLEIRNIFQQGAPCFCSARGPANYVVCPVSPFSGVGGGGVGVGIPQGGIANP